MAKPRKARHSQMPAVIQPAEEDAGYMPLLSHLHCRQPWILSWWSPILEHSFRVHIPDKSLWLALCHMSMPLLPGSWKKVALVIGCQKQQMSSYTSWWYSALVNILMHCVSKIYEPAGVYILRYDRYCQITFH